MDPRNGYPRSRAGPNGSSTHLSGGSNAHSSVLSSTQSNGSRVMSRAEKFEDEKRRIIDSCFAKTDADGGLQESYITHIRIREDAQYPQSPPPPDSMPSNKKDRVIVVAVKNTGRVRMHKGRENGNGTFSIGKTWGLEDLTGIESFTNSFPQSQEEFQRKDWGGDSGFICSVGKPYYWAAGSPKEKDFFIASLVKIYRKYTNGKVPDMIGFSHRELEPIIGAQAAQQQLQQQQSQPQPQHRTTPDMSRQAAFAPPAATSSTSLNGQRSLSPQPLPSATFQQRQAPPGPRTAPSQENLYSQRESPLQTRQAPGSAAYPAEPPQPSGPPRQLRSQQSQDRALRQPQSREYMRSPGAGALTTAPAPQRDLTPQSSRSEITHEPSESIDSSSLDSRGPRWQGVYPAESTASIDSLQVSRNDPAPAPMQSSAPPDRWKANGAASPSFQNRKAPSPMGPRAPVAPIAMPEAPIIPDSPPQRRRPLMVNQSQDNTGDMAMASALASARPRFAGANRASPSTESLSTVGANMLGGLGTPPAPSPMVDDDDSPIPAPLQIRPPSSRGPDTSGQSFTPAPMPPPSVPVPEPPRSKRTPVPAPVPEPEPEPEPEPPVSDPVQSPGSPISTAEEEAFRPGLGPMFKKSNVADKFKKAANAYGAFKPRAGGAFDRMKKVDAPSEGQDGITGVFQAPKPVRTDTEDSVMKITEDSKPDFKEAPAAAVQPPTVQTEDVPHVTVSSPLSPTPITETLPPDDLMVAAAPRSASSEPPRPKSKEEKEEAKKRRRRSQYQAKYLSSLGIEATLIDTRAFEFDAILSDFGWGGAGTGSVFQSKKLDVIEADLRRELGRVEAGSWLGTGMESKDERVEQVEKLLDRAIHEVEELEGLLTLYGVELSSLNEDIAFIEAQSQGLQVQTANQKLLQTELQNLIQTVDINPRQLHALKDGQIGQSQGLQEIEAALALLYKAMITIDPNIRSTGRNGAMQSSRFGDDLADMRALQEKRDRYISESGMFLDRLKQYMEFDFGRVLMDTEDAVKRASGSTRLDVGAHDIAHRALWRYGPLMLFAREIDMISWDSLMRMYQLRAKNVYQLEFKSNFEAWKRMTRKPSGDEHELLWTSADRDNDANLGQQARKMTVKRTMTLARTMRNASGEKGGLNDKTQIGRLYPYEAFAGALEEMTPLIFAEQNFIVDFFHASSTSNLDFLDAVMIAPPDARRGTNLMARKMVEPDRTLAGKIRETMDEMLSFWPSELQVMVQWATQSWGNGDPLQGVGMLQAIDRTLLSLEDTNQEYIIRALQKLHSSLSQQFSRLVDEQIKKIEDTKVKIKKRKGVIEFMRVFPGFSAAVETMMGSTADAQPNGNLSNERTETRNIIDDAYQKINRAMFDSLKVIAKESPSLSTQGQQPMGALATSNTDPEDKEALNYHILLIENMNHYLEEVEEHGDAVLGEWKRRARDEMEEHLNLYVDSVVRRPLGKLMDFLDTTTPSLSLTPSIASNPLTQSTSAGLRSPHAKSTLRKLLATHDAKDMRKGAEALRRRVEKHFSDGDEEQISRSLIGKVLTRCEEKYVQLADRAERARRENFDGEESASVPPLQWGERDARAVFKR